MKSVPNRGMDQQTEALAALTAAVQAQTRQLQAISTQIQTLVSLIEPRMRPDETTTQENSNNARSGEDNRGISDMGINRDSSVNNDDPGEDSSSGLDQSIVLKKNNKRRNFYRHHVARLVSLDNGFTSPDIEFPLLYFVCVSESAPSEDRWNYDMPLFGYGPRPEGDVLARLEIQMDKISESSPSTTSADSLEQLGSPSNWEYCEFPFLS